MLPIAVSLVTARRLTVVRQSPLSLQNARGINLKALDQDSELFVLRLQFKFLVLQTFDVIGSSLKNAGLEKRRS